MALLIQREVQCLTRLELEKISPLDNCNISPPPPQVDEERVQPPAGRPLLRRPRVSVLEPRRDPLHPRQRGPGLKGIIGETLQSWALEVFFNCFNNKE